MRFLIEIGAVYLIKAEIELCSARHQSGSLSPSISVSWDESSIFESCATPSALTSPPVLDTADTGEDFGAPDDLGAEEDLESVDELDADDSTIAGDTDWLTRIIDEFEDLAHETGPDNLDTVSLD